MAVYKRGEVYHYEFEHRGSRFRGSTGCTRKREAQEFERAKRQEAAKEAERREVLGRGPLTWGVAASRYWQEAGQHHSPHRDIASLEWLTRQIGRRRRSRRSTAHGRPARRQAPRRWRRTATVNRSVTEPLRRVLNRAKLWGEHLPPIEWRKHMLAEPRERVRELRAERKRALFAVLRADYHAIVRFALLTGAARAECVGLTWADVIGADALIWINGKGGKRASIPLPPTRPRATLALAGPAPSAVFTYAAASCRARRPPGRASPDHLRGARRREWARAVAAGGLTDSISTTSAHGCHTRPEGDGEPQCREADAAARRHCQHDAYAHTSTTTCSAGWKPRQHAASPHKWPPQRPADKAKAEAHH